MKQYSYTFTCNYLWTLFETIKLSGKKNSQVDNKENLKKIAKLKKLLPTTKFPDNLTFNNYFVYTMMPVFVYNVEYPRTARIDFGVLTSKLVNLVLLALSLRIIMEEFVIDDFLLSIPPPSASFLIYLRTFWLSSHISLIDIFMGHGGIFPIGLSSIDTGICRCIIL
ncbi:hypothetical protein NADFUDRAFT_50083 [Nadsonia fulvescens var. elongata DSM 6958]|uniref:Uncharacterized protein n=1 Tax=Nadsonia fulvescens var. elongata DSM 6958 TaxID=857566 RepID=A0A1E3PQG7_9ASCO|nr:hypothetical protein NADFUDRAFT_50083 [Nadsonia fulvescens var. elongata DSM 6958]